MNVIIPTLASILTIAGVVWVIRRLLHVALCPICLGVGGTWLWMLLARELGYPVDASMLAILLGGSVAGTAYLVEKRLPAARSALWWKTLFIPLGFVAAYAIATLQWVLLAVLVLALALLTVFFLRPSGASTETSEEVDELTRKMKNCC